MKKSFKIVILTPLLSLSTQSDIHITILPHKSVLYLNLKGIYIYIFS